MKPNFLKRPAPILLLAAGMFAGANASSAQYDRPLPPPAVSTPAVNDEPAVGAPAKPVGASITINKDEEDAYKVFYESRRQNPAAQISLGEAFLNHFPQSRYRAAIYSRLTSAYLSAGQEDKMFGAGDKAIALDPDNVDILALLAMAIPRRIAPTAPDAQTQYHKAEGYARHAIELTPKLAKPAGLSDAEFQQAKNEKVAEAYSGLGLIDTQRHNFEVARTELTQAVLLSANPDPVNYFLLGNADVQTGYYNDAAASYQKCAATGPMIQQCLAGQELARQDAATKAGK